MFLLGGPSSRLWQPDPLLRATLDGVPSALAVVGGSGHLAHCNAAWRALAARTATFGALGTLVTPEDVEGAAYTRRLASLDGPVAAAAHKLARSIEDTLAGRKAEARIPYHMHRPEGPQAFEATVSLLPAPTRLALVQHIDLADREHAADAAASAVAAGLDAEELRARLRLLERRLAALGRDLHTPITPVRLELHLLQGGALGPLTPAQGRALAIIERNVQRWADGEQGFPRLPATAWGAPAPCDLRQLAADAVEAARTSALKQGVRLVEPGPGAALPVVLPAERVLDVLGVFLARAVAATPAGGTVSVEVAQRDGEAVAEVRDSGPGLSAREVRDAFEPYGGRRPRPDAVDPMQLHHARAAVQEAGGRAYLECEGPPSGVLLGIAFPLQPAPA